MVDKTSGREDLNRVGGNEPRRLQMPSIGERSLPKLPESSPLESTEALMGKNSTSESGLVRIVSQSLLKAAKGSPKQAALAAAGIMGSLGKVSAFVMGAHVSAVGNTIYAAIRPFYSDPEKRNKMEDLLSHEFAEKGALMGGIPYAWVAGSILNAASKDGKNNINELKHTYEKSITENAEAAGKLSRYTAGSPGYLLMSALELLRRPSGGPVESYEQLKHNKKPPTEPLKNPNDQNNR